MTSLRLPLAAALLAAMLIPSAGAARPDDPDQGVELDRDAPPRKAITREDILRWMPVDPRALRGPVEEMRELAAQVARGTTDVRILRAYWRLQVRLYPFDFVPTKLSEALRQKKALERAQEAFAPLPTGCWSPLGPRNIPGRTTGLALHPTDPNLIYSAGADGGVWKTTDAGGSWVPLTDTQATLSIGAMAMDPLNPNVLYAGTGEGNYSGDELGGEGLLKSTDGGASFVLIPMPGVSRFHDIVVDRRNTSRVWAATSNGLFLSTDAGQTWNPAGGGLPAEDTMGIVISSRPGSNVLLAGIGRSAAGSTNRGLWRSTDGGASWTLVPSIPSGGNNGRLVLSQSPADPLRVYAALEDRTTGRLAGIYRSDDEGLTWTRTGNPMSTCSTYCWYCLVIAADAGDRDQVYVGGVSIYRSRDAGATWTGIINGGGPETAVHVDQHILYSPAHDVIWSTNDGGLNVSTDAGATWTFTGRTLETAQYYHITTDPTDDTYMIGGTQDNGTHQFVGGTSYNQILGGDGAYTAIDWNDPRIYYASSQNLAMSRSRARGPGMVGIGGGIAAGDPRGFIAPFALDRGNPNTVLAGTNRLWRSTDQGDNFVAVSPQLAGPGGVILAIDNCRDAPSSIWVGTSDGKVWNTQDGGGAWIDRTAGIPNRSITSITAHPNLPGTAWLTVGGTGVPHVFRTTDQGATWTPVSTGLPDVNFNRVLVIDDQPTTVVAAADLGVYRSDDSGDSWSVYGTDLPNVAVDWLSYAPLTGTLRAGTHGRGAWQLVPPNTCALTPDFAGLESISLIGSGTGCAPQLHWQPARSTCTLAPGLSYNVYRSTVAGFTPGPANLLVAGLQVLAYTDSAALPGTIYYYIVRAEDSQTVFGGPANGGKEDRNRVSLRAEIGDPFASGSLRDDGGDTTAWLQSSYWTISRLSNSTPGGAYSYHSGPDGSNFYTPDQCASLETPDMVLGAGATLSYMASYNLEDGWDGVVTEISTNGGGSWADLPPTGGYPGNFGQTQGNGCGFPPSRNAFSGPAGNGGLRPFARYTSSLAAFAGQTVRIRWRFSSDGGLEFEGFLLDDISVGPATAAGPQCTACQSGATRVDANSLRAVRTGPPAVRFSWTSPDPSGTWHVHQTASPPLIPNLWSDGASQVGSTTATTLLDPGTLPSGYYQAYGVDNCTGLSVP